MSFAKDFADKGLKERNNPGRLGKLVTARWAPDEGAVVGEATSVTGVFFDKLVSAKGTDHLCILRAKLTTPPIKKAKG